MIGAVPTHEHPAGPAPGRRLRRDAEANRQQILEAAGRLMAERGLSTPLEDIAAAAGVGIATLYRRFPNRDDLVQALFEDRLAAYLADLQAAVTMPDGWEAFHWFLRRASSRQIADRALKELLEQNPGHGAVSDLLERMWPLAGTLVKRAQATGRLRADFAVTDLVFVQQMLVSIGAATAPAGAATWERYLTFVIDGLVSCRDEPTAANRPALTVGDVEALHASHRRPAR